MSNVSNLFENLMKYGEATTSQKRVKKVQENDSTLLNLTVELPSDAEDITPEDIKVDVGVMNIDATGAEGEDVENQNDDNEDTVIDEESSDVTPENEDDTADEEKPEKEESLALRKEAIRKKRLEAKQLREAKKDCTGKEDCECESCKCKKESLVENSLDKAIDKYFDGDVKKWSFTDDKKDKVKVIFKDGSENEFSVTKFEETVDVETAKANIRKRVASKKECNISEVKKEALMHLDTKSLNKLFTEFVKENYKNIDKVVITKAMLENRMLKLEGTITDMNGVQESISFINRGFNQAKCEGKRFIMDFKDSSNTFNVIKENLKQPFVFTASLKNGTLTFESLKYSFKTKINESKIAEVSGKCVLNEGLFDGKLKTFVKKEIDKFAGSFKITPSDDGLGFVIETDNKAKLEKELERIGYKKVDNNWQLNSDNGKIFVTMSIHGDINATAPEYTVKFSARKKDVKNIK